MYVGRLLPFLQILAFPHTDKDILTFLKDENLSEMFPPQFQLWNSKKNKKTMPTKIFLTEEKDMQTYAASLWINRTLTLFLLYSW